MANPLEIKVVGANRENEKSSIIESIGRIGVINPISVYIDGDDIVLAAGHRRLASAIHFGLKDIPVKVVPKDRAAEVRALENMDRKALSPLDEALEIDALFKKGYSRKDIASIMGIAETRVSRRVRLRNLSEKARQALADGCISLRVAEEFAIMDQNVQDEIIDEDDIDLMDPDDVRKESWRKKGFSLESCTGDFIGLEGSNGVSCRQCPDNPRSNEELFGDVSGCGVCCNLKCWNHKLVQLFKQGEYEGLAINSQCPDEIVAFGDDVPVAHSYSNGHGWFGMDNEYGPAYMDIYGRKVRDSAFRKPDKETTEDDDDELSKEEVLKGLASRYGDLMASYESQLKLYRIAVRVEFEKTLPSLDSEENPLAAMTVEIAKGFLKHVGTTYRNSFASWTGKESVEDLSPAETVSSALAFSSTRGVEWYATPCQIGPWTRRDSFKRGDFKSFATAMGVDSPEILGAAIDGILDEMDSTMSEYNRVAEEQ